jgi:DNA (cytosine-5)-methyltransferase 1
LSAAHLVKLKGTCRDGQRVDEPAPTIAAGGNHAGMVYAFLTKFYGSGGQWQGCREPLHTVPATERFNVVLVYVGGEPYVIVDICMRMLTPRELARAQGFPDEYVIDKGADGQTLSKRDQVRLIGNSVPPAFARAIVRENVVRAGVVGPAKARRRKRKAVAI